MEKRELNSLNCVNYNELVDRTAIVQKLVVHLIEIKQIEVNPVKLRVVNGNDHNQLVINIKIEINAELIFVKQQVLEVTS